MSPLPGGEERKDDAADDDREPAALRNLERLRREKRYVYRSMMPPSPRLSARMISVTYLSVTTIMIAQNTTDKIPSTLSGVSGKPCGPVKHSRRVYSGLVPMSPKTTPIAPMTSGARGLRASGASGATAPGAFSMLPRLFASRNGY